MTRAQLNAAIESLLKHKRDSGEAFTMQDIALLQQYEGKGGLASKGVTDRGVLYEYYTPDAIVRKMWALAYHHGFKRGHILEPSVGTGRFLHYVDPSTCSVEAYEYSKDDTIGYQIACASFPWATITNDYFETIFYRDNKRLKVVEPRFDLVIGNPPYGKFTGYYAGKGREASRTLAKTYDQYFIEKGIELLKPEGLLVFIIPSSFLDNESSYQDFKTNLATQAMLIDAYRLPANVFAHTQIQTDIIVFRKKGYGTSN